jgi:hypothetical protein
VITRRREYEPEGQYLRALHHPIVQVQTVVAGRLITALEVADSSPRALIQSVNGTGTRAVQPPWAPKMAISAVGESIVVSKGVDYPLQALTGGAVVKEYNTAIQYQALTDSLRNAWVKEWKASGRNWSAAAEAEIAKLPVPMRRPAIGQVFASPQGQLAIVRRDKAKSAFSDRDSVYIDLFRENGLYMGYASLAPGTVIHAYTGTELWTSVLTTQDSGVQWNDMRYPLQQIVQFKIDS